MPKSLTETLDHHKCLVQNGTIEGNFRIYLQLDAINSIVMQLVAGCSI